MFDNFTKDDTDLNEAIAAAFADLKAHSADEDGYSKTVDQLSKLYKLKHDGDKIALDAVTAQAKNELEASKNDAENSLAREQWQHELDLAARPFFKRVDPNVALTVGGNLIIGLAVIKHERTAVITSKVWSFLMKK